MSNSFRSRTALLCVAGALLVPCISFAQSTVPSITPVDGAPPVGTAPVPAPVTSSPTTPNTTKPVIDTMEFKDIEVTEALSMISSAFKLPIAINGDVTGKIAYINLTGNTADQALNAIIKTAHLSCRLEDGIYIISTPSPDTVPALAQPGSPITPVFGTGNQFGGFTTSPGIAIGGSSTAGIETSKPKDPGDLVPLGSGTDSKKRVYSIPINNVTASWMAYWLDPANHSAPIQVQQQEKANDVFLQSTIQKIAPAQTPLSGTTGISTVPTVGVNSLGGVVPSPVPGPLSSDANSFINSNAEQLQTLADAQFGGGRQGGGGGVGGGRNGGQNGGRNGNNGVFPLPTGVDRIVAVDPQNALLVFGTPAGVAELQNTINFLDKPLKQVEVETQFVSVNVTDAKGYGLDFTTAQGNFNASATGLAPNSGNGALSVGFLRGNFQAALSAFANSSRSKVLASPRVLAINNLTAIVTQTVSFPIVLNTTTTVVGNAAATNQSQGVNFVNANISLAVTPTINNDGTITVLLSPNFTDSGLASSAAAQALGLPQFTTQTVQTIANVRDGETIALGGLRRKNISFSKTRVPLLGDLPLIGRIFQGRTSNESDTELIIFVTARIVHREGDDSDNVPGTQLGGTP